LCKLCELEDFSDADLRALIRSAYANEAARFGEAFPTGREYRKFWEVAMSLNAFRELGVLGADSEFLGVGAGSEATVFWLTNHARRVFATDLYLENGQWAEQAPRTMLSDPSPYAPCPWNPRRLVVQEMNALELRYDDGSFDGVFSASAIEHFGDLEAVRRGLAEIRRVLKPGGVASLSTEYRIRGHVSELPTILLFDERQLRSLLADDGWELAEPLDLHLSDATLAGTVNWDSVMADIQAGRDWTFPHIVLEHSLGVTWTSVHVALRRTRESLNAGLDEIKAA
jgi:SAM-dependent methyltransferase